MRQYDEEIRGYIQEAGKYKILSREEEIALFKRHEAGDRDAFELIVKHNLRFVIKVALTYMGRGLSLSDLVQEGNVGLLEVIEKYDYHKGFRFSTYAAFWIRQAIQIALRRHGSMIALPIRKSRLLGRIAEAQSRFLMDEGREPTTRELADFLHEKEGTIQDLLLMKDSVLSLDTAAVAEDESSTLMDRLTDENALSPLDACVKNQMKAKVAALMEILNEREKRIMRLRFGFEHGKSLSLRKTSALVGLSQEGVRRIEAKALTKLRRPTIMAKMAALV